MIKYNGQIIVLFSRCNATRGFNNRGITLCHFDVAHRIVPYTFFKSTDHGRYTCPPLRNSRIISITDYHLQLYVALPSFSEKATITHKFTLSSTNGIEVSPLWFWDNFMHKEDLHRYMVSGYIGYTIVSIGTVCFVEYLRVVRVAVLTTSGTKMGLFSYVLLHVYTFACAALSDTVKRWS